VFQGAFMGSSYFVGNGALLAVLLVGSFQLFEGNISAGNLAGFCMYAGHLTESVIELSHATGGFLQAQGSGARLFALLETGEAKSYDAEIITTRAAGSAMSLPPSYNPTIRFEEVEFAYPAHPHMPVLTKLSFTLRYGEMLALTGLSGSGKSSIMSLLMRFYEPNSGRITLDGVDIKDLDIDWLRSQVGLVGQEPILFHASVFENVAYGKPHSTHDEVIEACVAAGAHRFILELPDQYNTIVGGRGASISG
jgi:ABC-type multidrug transport system fused ATPase/permease subunit